MGSLENGLPLKEGSPLLRSSSVFSLENGPAHAIWREIGVPLSVNTADENMKCSVDWLNLMQEPFKNVPLVWTIHEQTLAARLRQYVSSGHNELVDTWRKFFSRATVVVFPNYILPMAYSVCDPGNYFVIPGSPEEAWKADKQLVSVKNNLRLEMAYGPDDFVVAVVGSQLSYGGLWLEHAFVLQALYPLLRTSMIQVRLKIIISAGDSTSNYSKIVEVSDKVNGYLFPQVRILRVLTKVMFQMVSNGKLSPVARLMLHRSEDLKDRTDQPREHGMRYIEMLEELIGHCTKEMKENLKGRANHCENMGLFPLLIGSIADIKMLDRISQSLRATARMKSLSKTAERSLSDAIGTKAWGHFVLLGRLDMDRNPLKQDFWSFCDAINAGNCQTSIATRVYSSYSSNAWAYHSARRIVYVDPETGFMQEQHNLKNRRGQMWIKFFQFSTLKTMDEDLAEEFDRPPQKTAMAGGAGGPARTGRARSIVLDPWRGTGQAGTGLRARGGPGVRSNEHVQATVHRQTWRKHVTLL
ncbi:hypothetical protein DH2020_025192 [Rehmannia glutinosa]|uniref:Uncharacterized protein n=1 Tax=Rehmannia glutinosa TaxID=99300 RepID=A0ABR0W4F3_REHGL